MQPSLSSSLVPLQGGGTSETDPGYRRITSTAKAWHFAGPCIFGTSRPRYGTRECIPLGMVAETGACMSRNVQSTPHRQVRRPTLP